VIDQDLPAPAYTRGRGLHRGFFGRSLLNGLAQDTRAAIVASVHSDDCGPERAERRSRQAEPESDRHDGDGHVLVVERPVVARDPRLLNLRASGVAGQSGHQRRAGEEFRP
jgi:hypothetical protein